MKSTASVGFIVAAAAASTTALTAVANAAPTGPSSVDQTVQTLEASGCNVIVNRTGAAPLSQCTVRVDRAATARIVGGMRLPRTVYVDVAC
jgi:hypothetical protein